MANRTLRIAAQVSSKTRELLLRHVPPNLAQVFCQNITYAYDVTSDAQYPQSPVTATITGVHRTAQHEALICTVNGQAFRPDGKRFHITLSTSPGVKPAEAGNNIDDDRIERLSTPIEIEVLFELGHARQLKAEPIEKIAA